MPSAALASPSQAPVDRLIRHRDGSRPRVLYAEDSPSSRVVTTAMLERMGLEVHAVEDGEDALRAAENSVFDVILLDIEMPVMDGVAAAREIRALGGAHATTPILALSAFLADSTELSHWRGAFDHAVPKPANGNELNRAIRKALESAPAPAISVNTAEPGGIAEGLRSSLSPGLWSRLASMAAGESMHYANAAAFAFECRDDETLRRCLHSLRGLALSFKHPALILALLEIDATGASEEKLQQVCALAAKWPSQEN
jgi:CheY-like chemotaxis protein